MIIRNDTPLAEEVVQRIRENDGYCCCAIVKSPETKCMCADFREQIKDPNFFGECTCGLYKKVPEVSVFQGLSSNRQSGLLTDD